ncbi:MAG TPA: TetR/AcrR family transcriptional regulator [Sphingomonas sp.]|nr:TetR/AcrR family transcriptional regulator [Sphingomonas sp.]
MPRSNSEDRRRQVCDIAGRLLARAGLEAVTVREVAREAGCSTRIVSHHFSNKHELLLLVFNEFSGRALAACEAALAEGKTLAAALEAILPIDDERRMYWQIWLAFWGKIAEDPEFRDAQVTRAHQMRGLIEHMLAICEGAGAGEDHDWSFEADRLLTILVGIATQGVFDPERWDAERQRNHLQAEIEALRAARH